MKDPDRVWDALVGLAQQAPAESPAAVPDGFLERLTAALPAARAGASARLRERYVFHTAAAAVAAALFVCVWTWPAFAKDSALPVVVEDIVSWEPMP